MIINHTQLIMNWKLNVLLKTLIYILIDKLPFFGEIKLGSSSPNNVMSHPFAELNIELNDCSISTTGTAISIFNS